MHKPDFRKAEIKLCFLRSICVTLFLLIAYLITHIFDDSIWMTPLAATTFIAFAFPKAEAVRNRFLLGGYISAGVWGVAISYLTLVVGDSYLVLLVLAVLSVFLTSLTMTIFDFEHPPSAALAIGLVLADQPLKMALASIICIVILCLIKMPLAKLILKEKPSAES